MNYLLYCAINSKRILHETIYSVLALFEYDKNPKFEVIIISNFNKYYFSILAPYKNVVIETISDELVDEWIKDGYVYNLKIYAIMYVFNKIKGNVIFVDSDVFFIRCTDSIIEQVEKSTFIMNYKKLCVEDVIEKTKTFALSEIEDDDNRIRVNFYRSIYETKKIPSINNNGLYLLPEKFYSFNSGVIGINYNYKNILSDVLDVSMGLYKEYKYSSSEEFAFSYIFNHTGEKIHICNDIAYHYNLQETRLILGYLLNYFYLDDEEHFNTFIRNKNINIKQLKAIEISEIPYFLAYIYKEDISLAKKNKSGIYGEYMAFFKTNYIEAKKLFNKMKEIERATEQKTKEAKR